MEEFDKLIEGCWADGSPILSFRYFELVHNKKRSIIRGSRELCKNWTEYIIEDFLTGDEEEYNASLEDYPE